MKRHALSTRLWHWINALAFVVLFMSGLNISNAHRALYWGDYGYDMSEAWLIVARFPSWMTIPQRYDLAEARDWHNLSAWAFALGLLVMWATSLLNRHFARDIATSLEDWRPDAWKAAIKEHTRPGDHGDRSYNAVQKITYGLVLGIGLPMMIATGLAISPGFEVAAPWLVDAFGGRQSARSLHFICAWGLAGFVALHLFMVLWSGPVKQIGRMITGGRREGDTNA
ncbi:cytochrome b/b6 domain-containing protein [Erythrobacter sp. SCSIO 43205]|uniref:cytochrome b/b6 domain-containing protein n=1 Tax=Erythrobacter sp. SCSIO 43205 TaxID=2779361 RepID=UPI001CA9A8C1|nr:cytochrome b/b6 domain-containing protein [Erythrobacter sp. SCSIO 43205]UAB77426.1 cytochrome b/b6 domain-containing protein [Erythrobacter sp. SCSIO 43205]